MRRTFRSKPKKKARLSTKKSDVSKVSVRAQICAGVKALEQANLTLRERQVLETVKKVLFGRQGKLSQKRLNQLKKIGRNHSVRF